jgi:hypothetical protein
MKENWPPVMGGLFDGSYERAKTIIDGFNESISDMRWLRN